jgi:glutamate:GABA antiporter
MRPLKTKRILGLFPVIMINVIAVDSIRTLPFSAEYGFSLLFYYLVASIMFFIPSALVSAELGSGWPTTGGIYIWAREAFGKTWGLIVIWLEWICNVVWYPTIMALIAGVLAYFFNPALAENKTYMICTILVIFWAATFLNCLGMKASSWLSIVSAIVGTIIPMMFIALLGVVWWIQGHPMQIECSWKSFFPSRSGLDNLAFLSNVLFGLIGLDMAATHAAEMKNPTKDYPKALGFSVVIILATIVLASLAIAITVPLKELSLVTGSLQAFVIFLDKFHLPWLVPVMAFFIVLGSLGGVGAWIIGPTKGLMVASRDGSLPSVLGRVNKHGAPARVLILQGVVVSLLCLVFIIMPSVHSSFWLLSIITAQLAMIVYVFLFLAGIRLQYTQPDIPRPFKVPYGKPGMILVGSLGVIACLIAIGLGFIVPSHVGIENAFNYECLLIGGLTIMCFLPYIIHKFSKKLGK